mmetsp:Transcript_133354/g.242756  ORF Transcript_133354/g.242756 Transcript_133354/m.242756 type:complete len:113 (-) Transcript_133354:99-437(-)
MKFELRQLSYVATAGHPLSGKQLATVTKTWAFCTTCGVSSGPSRWARAVNAEEAASSVPRAPRGASVPDANRTACACEANVSKITPGDINHTAREAKESCDMALAALAKPTT